MKEKLQEALNLIDEMLDDYRYELPLDGGRTLTLTHLGCMGPVRSFGKKQFCIDCQLQLVKKILKDLRGQDGS